jgi:hypothetical protein
MLGKQREINMSEPSHLEILRRSLAQCEEALPEIHDHYGQQIMEDHADLLRADIRRLEAWEKKQEAIRAQGGETFGSELKCGEA